MAGEVRDDNVGDVSLSFASLVEVEGVDGLGAGLLLAILLGVDMVEMSSSGAGRFLEGDIAMISPIDILMGTTCVNMTKSGNQRNGVEVQ